MLAFLLQLLCKDDRRIKHYRQCSGGQEDLARSRLDGVKSPFWHRLVAVASGKSLKAFELCFLFCKIKKIKFTRMSDLRL